jgi:hypothetical protein
MQKTQNQERENDGIQPAKASAVDKRDIMVITGRIACTSQPSK